MNPDLSDDQHYRVPSLHEAGHMVTGLALGFTSEGLWMLPERPLLNQGAQKGGQASLNCTGYGQYIATWLEAGAVSQERALVELGFTETTHPRPFDDCRGSHKAGDNAEIDRLKSMAPEMFLDEQRANRDAGRLLESPRLWEATHELAADLRQNLSLSPERIHQVLSPYQVDSAVNEKALRIWTPDEIHEVHTGQSPEQKQTGSAALASDRPRPQGPTLREALNNAGTTPTTQNSTHPRRHRTGAPSPRPGHIAG